MNTLTTAELVEKEMIPSLSFRNSTVTNQDPSIREKLNLAMRGGNSNRIKYQIEFMTDTGLKTVATTVWAAGDKYVCLKGGVWIPIANIANIRTL